MPRFSLTATVLDTPDPKGLALFYQRLLGWPLATDEPDWVTLRRDGGGAGLSFQREEDHVPPVWPPPSTSRSRPARPWPGSSRRTTSACASTRPATPFCLFV